MKIKFYKYHGTGNDFILIDNRLQNVTLASEDIIRMCERRYGIGADGLIFLQHHPDYDFEMKYYNADGSPATMCGNGGRCISALAAHLGIGGENLRFIAGDGPHQALILSVQGLVSSIRLSMRDVPAGKPDKRDYLFNTGTPHFVRFLRDANDPDFDTISEGRSIRYHERFASTGINVNFVSALGDGIFVRTYEKGVEDETLSCGTGVTASALAWAMEQDLTKGPVSVRTRGGLLYVDFLRNQEGFRDIWLTGPAVQTFEGAFEITQ